QGHGDMENAARFPHLHAPAATTDKPQTRRYTNNLPGTKSRSAQWRVERTVAHVPPTWNSEWTGLGYTITDEDSGVARHYGIRADAICIPYRVISASRQREMSRLIPIGS